MIKIKSLASGSAGNCYYITDGRSPLLIEAGIPIIKIKEGLDYNIHQLYGCFITHRHKDHSKAIKDLIQYGVNCYMNEDAASEYEIHHRIAIVEPERGTFHVGNWQVKPFKTEHDVDSLGYYFRSNYSEESLVYLTDSYYSKYRFPDLNYIMVECNYAEDILNKNIESGRVPVAQKNRIIKSHMSLETVKDILRVNDLSQVKQIWLLHLSDRNSHAERFKREVQEIAGCPVYIAGGE